MSYGLIGSKEGIATREDTRAEDSSFRFVKLDQYLDETEMSGIPQPPVRKNLHSFVHFAIAVLLLLLCTVGIYLHNGVYDTINLSEGSEQINIHVSGCDVLFRPVKPGEMPGLHYRTWNFMGKAHVEVADGTINLHLVNSHRMPLFHCNAVFRLHPGTEITNELRIVQTGGYAAILTEPDEGESSLLVVGRTVRFNMEHVQCQLSKLEAPKAEIIIERGLLELNDPHVADLTLATVSAPVSLVSHKRPVHSKLPKAIADHCALYAGELDVQDDDIMDVILSPKGAKGLANSAMVANISTQQAPIVVLCGKEDDDLQTHKGKHHLTPKLIAGASAIRSLESFVEDSKGLPYIVNVRVIGFGLPQGLWQMMSTTAYLALSVDWLVLLSFGALKPRVFEVSVHALGLGLDVDTDEVFEVLWDKLGHVFAHSTIAWVPTEGRKSAMLYEYDGKDYRKRHVANSDTIGFMISLVLNLAGAVAIVAYLARFCLTIVYPYVMARQCERTITKCASHRLCLAGSQDTWQLSACRVPFNPAAGVRQAGVLLRWKRRKNYMLFTRYSIRCQSEGHRFTLPINKQFVMPSANNPSQLKVCISS